jgi:bacterioferritin (cytochrome b1)
MKADATVVANLQAGASLECALQLQLHLDVRELKDIEMYDFAHKVDGWGECSEWIVKRISKRLILFRVDPDYDGGKPKAITTSLTAILQNELKMEQNVHDQYEDFCQQARAAKDESTAHDWKDYIHVHEKRIGWLERKLRQIDNFGENEYALEAMG